MCWGLPSPPSPSEHLLHLTWPWCWGCVACEAGHSSLVLQMELTTQINTTLRRDFKRGSQAWESKSLPAHVNPSDRWLTDGDLCSVGKNPSRPRGFSVRKGRQGCQEPAAQEVKMEEEEKAGRQWGQEANQKYD